MTISKNDYQAAAKHWRGTVNAIASESDMTADEAGQASAFLMMLSVNALKTRVEALEVELGKLAQFNAELKNKMQADEVQRELAEWARRTVSAKRKAGIK